MRFSRPLSTDWRPWAVGALLILALYETANALIAPWRAPSPADWAGAARTVRAEFRPGDLIVAAPAWADDVLRWHLGDLLPVAIAARLDDARYGRVWEISQRGARAAEGTGKVALDRDFGALRLRRFERKAAAVSFDFVERWAQAKVVRREPGRGDIACERGNDRFSCPLIGFNFVAPGVLEIGHTLRRALYAQPVDGAAVVITFPEVTLGTELAVAGGLHHVWLRKAGDGEVLLRVFVGDQLLGQQIANNRSGWQRTVFDTRARAGTSAPVSFEITSARPLSRHFGFAAEARGS